MEEDTVRPIDERSYPLDQAGDALLYFGEGAPWARLASLLRVTATQPGAGGGQFDRVGGSYLGGAMTRLALILRIQAIVLAIYGLGFTFVPGPIVEGMFGWDGVDHTLLRASGIAFLVLAWAEWLVVQNLESRLDFVMPYLLLPAAFVVAFAVDRYVTDTYAGPDGFWWTNFVVVAVFTIAVLWGRMAVTEATEATHQS